ncbi:MAG: FAD-binding protein [Nakamurella sp.]
MTIASPFTASHLAATLRASIHGDVLTPDDASFPAATFGVTGDNPPDLAIIAADAEDVGTVLRLTSRTGHRVLVAGRTPFRAGAGSILLVTRLLARVIVDQVGRTATIGVGASWRQIIDATAPMGLAPVSINPETVPADLGDRLTALCRRLGLSTEHVRGFELVGPLGEPVHIDARRDPDLFRSLRGAGWSGFITAVTVELLPAGPLYAGGLLFADRDGAQALDRWREWSATLPATCSTSARWLRLPDRPHVPAELRGQSVVHIRFAHIGDPVEGDRLIAPLRAVGPLLDTVREMPWSVVVRAPAGQGRLTPTEMQVQRDRTPAGLVEHRPVACPV